MSNSKHTERIESERERIRAKIHKLIGKNLGYGLLPIAQAVKQVADEIAADPAKAKEALGQNYRGAVKQLTDFVAPQKQEIEHSGAVQGIFTPEELAALTPKSTEPDPAEEAWESGFSIENKE